ncbi:MAG TPA: hypothetical protein VEC76_19920 [Streptosporangiaceae bacterium]|nr:hypothetical protein [Streptosporangiaceae bacterium]
MNANDATLTELATTQSGSMVKDDAPNAPAGGGFDLIIAAVAGSALGSSGAPYTLTISTIDLTAVSQPWPPRILHQAFDAASGWKLSGTGPDYECTQAIPNAIPGGPSTQPHHPHLTPGHDRPDQTGLRYAGRRSGPGAQGGRVLLPGPFDQEREKQP